MTAEKSSQHFTSPALVISRTLPATLEQVWSPLNPADEERKTLEASHDSMNGAGPEH